MILKKVISVCILVWLMVFPSFGQEQIASVKGTVKNEEGIPIPNAKLTFIYLRQNLRAETETNKDGEYVRAGLRPGVYKVTVEAEGYATWEKGDIRIRAGETDMGGAPKLDIIMETAEKAKKREQAIQYEKDLVVIKKEYEEAMQAFAARDFDIAIEKYKKILELDPNQYVVAYNLGMSYINMMMFEEAAEALKRGLDIQPENSEANFYLAYSLMMAQKEKASEVEEEAGETEESKNKLEEAEIHFLKSLEFGFDDPDALFSMGAVLVSNRREEAALKAFTKAVEINPDFERAFIEMATSHVKLGNYERAKDLFQQYLKEHPEGEYAPRAEQMLQALEKILERKE